MINFDNLAWLPCVSQSCWWVGTCQEWEYVWVRLLYSSQIGFSTSRAFDISEALWKHRRAVLFVGVLLKKRFLPTSYSPVDFFFFMSFLVYIRNNCLSHSLRGLQEPDLTIAHSRWLSCVRPSCRLDIRKKLPVSLQEALWLCSWLAVPLVLLVLILEVMPYSTASSPTLSAALPIAGISKARHMGCCPMASAQL